MTRTFSTDLLINGKRRHGKEKPDVGRFNVTKNEADRSAFKTPTLRSIELSAPYFHDGSVATLQEVVAIYARGGRLISGGPLAGDGARNPHKDPRIRGFAISNAETVHGFLSPTALAKKA